MRAMASGQVAMTSAAERYARILNAFSFLISSRSAICASTCAMDLLSTRQPVALERVVEQPRASAGEGSSDLVARCWRPVAEHAAAASSAADLRRRRACCGRSGDQILDGRRGHARRQLLTVLPLASNRAPDRVPVAALERLAHVGGRVADALEAVEDETVAVDVTLGDFPVVRAGVSRLAGVAEDDSLLQLGKVDAQRHSLDAVGLEFHRGNPAIERWTIVLQSRRHVDGARLDVHCHL